MFADGHDVVFFFITHTHIRDAHVCMMHPAFSLFIITRANVYFFFCIFVSLFILWSVPGGKAFWKIGCWVGEGFLKGWGF